MSMLCDPKSTFKYTPGGNCQAIWRKYGWVPPSEYRDDYLFKTNREAGESHEEVANSIVVGRK
jgi:hypothetical protein